MKERKDFMTPAQAARMAEHAKRLRIKGDVPRTHENMRAVTGVARPGKTAKDRANRGRGNVHG